MPRNGVSGLLPKNPTLERTGHFSLGKKAFATAQPISRIAFGTGIARSLAWVWYRPMGRLAAGLDRLPRRGGIEPLFNGG
jgi:hypothetical protein